MNNRHKKKKKEVRRGIMERKRSLKLLIPSPLPPLKTAVLIVSNHMSKPDKSGQNYYTVCIAGSGSRFK
jgi:hypothetical protein